MGRGKRRRRNAVTNHRLPTSDPLTQLFNSISRKPSTIETRRRIRDEIEWPTVPKRKQIKWPDRPRVNRVVPRGARFVGYEPAPVKAFVTEASGKSICEERKERTEVMHATGKAGKRGQKSPIWTKKSKVRC